MTSGVDGVRVSTVITTFQLERFVAEAIRSIQAQTRPVDEIVVVDNGSTDSTLAIVEDFARDDPRIRIVHESSKGAANVRNRALKCVDGDFIAFLDGDDTWPKEKIALQLARHEAGPRIDVVTGRTAYVEAIDPETLEAPPGVRTEVVYNVNIGACLYRPDVFERIGGFDPQFRYSDDLDLMFRIRDAGLNVVALDAITLFYRRYMGSLITTQDPNKAREFARIVGLSRKRREKAGLPPPPPFHDLFRS